MRLYSVGRILSASYPSVSLQYHIDRLASATYDAVPIDHELLRRATQNPVRPLSVSKYWKNGQNANVLAIMLIRAGQGSVSTDGRVGTGRQSPAFFHSGRCMLMISLTTKQLCHIEHF
jgi:hypothetical protein